MRAAAVGRSEAPSRSPRSSVALLAGVGLLASVTFGTTFVSVAAPDSGHDHVRQRAPLKPARDAFGFRVGEERRYVYAPRDYLEPGEVELWTISLDSIDAGDGDGMTAVFDLSYESKRYVRRGNIFNPDEMQHLLRTTRLRVNRHGFPVEIEDSLEQTGRNWQDRRVYLRWADGHFEVSDPQSMTYRRFHLTPPANVDSEGEVPYGVFVSAEVNPGLLSLPFHAAERDRSRAQYFALMLGGRIGRSFPDHARSGFDARAMTFHESNRIPVGRFTTTAQRVRVERRDWWVAPDGKVLMRPVSRPTGRIDALRILWPSEY